MSITGTVATVDPKKFILTVAGIPLTGYAKKFIKITRAANSYDMDVGADGSVCRVKSNNYSGEFEVTLMQSSPSNALLSALCIADENFGTGIVAVTGTDLSGTSINYAGAAWVRKPAEQTNGVEANERVWVLDCAALSCFIGGNFTTEDFAADTAALIASLTV